MGLDIWDGMGRRKRQAIFCWDRLNISRSNGKASVQVKLIQEIKIEMRCQIIERCQCQCHGFFELQNSAFVRFLLAFHYKTSLQKRGVAWHSPGAWGTNCQNHCGDCRPSQRPSTLQWVKGRSTCCPWKNTPEKSNRATQNSHV